MMRWEEKIESDKLSFEIDNSLVQSTFTILFNQIFMNIKETKTDRLAFENAEKEILDIVNQRRMNA